MVRPDTPGRGFLYHAGLYLSNFLDNLRKQGYIIKDGKYLAVRPPGKERFVRLKTLEDICTEEAIRQRIREHEKTPLYTKPIPAPRRRYKLHGKRQWSSAASKPRRKTELLTKWRISTRKSRS